MTPNRRMSCVRPDVQRETRISGSPEERLNHANHNERMQLKRLSDKYCHRQQHVSWTAALRILFSVSSQLAQWQAVQRKCAALANKAPCVEGRESAREASPLR